MGRPSDRLEKLLGWNFWVVALCSEFGKFSEVEWQ